MCLANYSSCDRYHCKITGPGFFGLGILTTLDTVGLVNPPAWVVFSALLALLGWVLVLNANFYKILKLVELGFSNWWTVSANLAIAYNNMNQIQKEQIRKSYMGKFGEFPDIEQFLQLGRKRNKFEESFLLPYENHVRYHKSDSKSSHSDPNCVICKLEKSFEQSANNRSVN
jgi:hypothetical protein